MCDTEERKEAEALEFLEMNGCQLRNIHPRHQEQIFETRRHQLELMQAYKRGKDNAGKDVGVQTPAGNQTKDEL